MTGFVMVPRWLRLRKPSSNAGWVYVNLAARGRMNTDLGVYEECRPSIPTLADDCALSESTVRRALTELADLGAVVSQRRWNADGSPAPSIYRCLFHDPADLDSPPVEEGGPPVEDPGVTGGTTPGVTGGTRVVSPVTGNQEPSTQNPDTQKKPSKASPSRGTRIPDDFEPSDEMRAWYRAEVGSLINGAAEHATFIDYWRSQPGAKGVKLDWEATWRNWMRRAAQRTGSRPNGAGRSFRQQDADAAAAADDLRTRAEAALAQMIATGTVKTAEPGKHAATHNPDIPGYCTCGLLITNQTHEMSLTSAERATWLQRISARLKAQDEARTAQSGMADRTPMPYIDSEWTEGVRPVTGGGS